MTRSPRLNRAERSGLDISDEAVHLLRQSPGALAVYGVAALPFALGLLYFWGEMSYGADAQQRLPAYALFLTLLFAWMKAGQPVYARMLTGRLAGTHDPWTRRRLVRMAVNQAILQPTGLIVLPLALLLLLPFGWCCAYYQNLTVLDDGREGIVHLSRQAWRQARLWPRQNHVCIWLLSPLMLLLAGLCTLVVWPVLAATAPFWTLTLFMFAGLVGALLIVAAAPLGILLWGNILIAIYMIPQLLHALLGVELPITQTGAAGWGSTAAMVALALTVLAMDPIFKAAYVLRCFEGVSLRTGDDLRGALRRLGPPIRRSVLAGLLFAAGLGAVPANAQEAPAPPPVSPQALEEAIHGTLQQREYRWRFPREFEFADGESQGYLAGFLRRLNETLKAGVERMAEILGDFLRWLGDRMPSPSAPGPRSTGIDWTGALESILWVLTAVLAVTALALVLRMWLSNRKTVVEAVPAAPAPVDLTDENLGAEALPEEDWLRLAQDMAAQGQWRLAVRAMHLAMIVRLSSLALVRLARHKTNRDYTRELRRRAHAEQQALRAWQYGMSLFERIWYGRYEATQHELTQMRRAYAALPHPQNNAGPNPAPNAPTPPAAAV